MVGCSEPLTPKNYQPRSLFPESSELDGGEHFVNAHFFTRVLRLKSHKTSYSTS